MYLHEVIKGKVNLFNVNNISSKGSVSLFLKMDINVVKTKAWNEFLYEKRILMLSAFFLVNS